jgi:hypothetical protein
VEDRSGTKPGSILKRQIPIRTFADWDDARPGFCEVDLMAHDGGDPAGDFCQTHTLTCVATGWTEVRALRNKAQRWCFEALVASANLTPFAVWRDPAEVRTGHCLVWPDAPLVIRALPSRTSQSSTG